MNDQVFPGRVAIQQRVLPAYRAPFFEALAAACQRGLSVYAGQPLAVENIEPVQVLQVAQYVQGKNRHFFHPGSPLYRCRQGGLVEWLEAWQPDVLVVEANPRYTATPQAIRWMRARRRPVLGWGLGAPPLHGFLAFWRRRGRLRFLRSIDGMIAYSQRGAEQYGALGFPAERIFVAPNAAAPRPTWPMPDRPPDFDGFPRVLFVGRLQARKRLDRLLMACAALPKDSWPRLWIVGDGPAREELQTLAAAVFPSAEFLGARYGAELEACFRQADLFVLPGTGGLAIQQALAYGLPVIVGEADGTQEELVLPQNGWQIQIASPASSRAAERDVPALAQALKEALSDPIRLRRMGEASFRIARETANLETMVEVFLQAFGGVTGDPRYARRGAA